LYGKEIEGAGFGIGWSPGIFRIQKDKFEPVVEVPPQNRVIINTSKPIEENVRRVLDMFNLGVRNE